MQQWYALHTKPHKEISVSQYLAQRGTTTYLPAVPKVYQGRRLQTTEPLFPTYLFARLDLDIDGFANVRWTPGVRDIVHGGDGAIPVDPNILAHIEERLAEGQILRSAVHERFRPDERVRLKGQPFDDLDLVFDHYLPGELRAVVLMHFLGRKTPAVVAVDALQKASSLRSGLVA